MLLISPATCCLVNQDKERTVEKAFQLTQNLYETAPCPENWTQGEGTLIPYFFLHYLDF
jgi:hypothetical protein